MSEFKPLALTTLAPRTGYARHYYDAPSLVSMTSSALEVMTDLRFIAAETIRANVTIEESMQKMIVRGVRSLLVIDTEDDVIGIVTSRDLLQSASRSDGTPIDPRSHQVAHVMTPAELIEVLDIDAVLHAHVGDIVETLKSSGRQHALVAETDPISAKTVIRGVFSASQIARQLGVAPDTSDLQQTFQQIDKAMRG